MDDENTWKPSREPNPWRGQGSARRARFADAACAAHPVERLQSVTFEPVVWTIYRHTHTATDRCYVGQTMRTWEERWAAHQRDSLLHPLLFAAIQEHGVRAFRHEVLERVDTQAKANDAEKKWIAHFGCLDPDGYNQREGGARLPTGLTASDQPATRMVLGKIDKVRGVKVIPIA